MAEVLAEQSRAPDMPVEELEKERAWWWAAEKKRSKRLDYLRKAIWKKGRIGGTFSPGLKASMQDIVLRTEGYKANAGVWPSCLRFARMEAHIIDNIPIFITDHSQVVGYLGESPSTFRSSAEGTYNEPDIIPEPAEENLKILAEVGDYWLKEGPHRAYLNTFDPEDLMKVMGGQICFGVPIFSGGGYAGVNYEYIMKGERGFEDIIAEIEKSQDAMREEMKDAACPETPAQYEKIRTWQAMVEMLEAVIRWARRYARLARIVAENFEADPKRKEELLRISETCERVPAKPPRTLQESIQLDHFIQVLKRYESVEGAWPARPDYYHGPFYEKDVNIDKRITKEEALDLVGEHLIRAADMGVNLGRWASEGLQGISGTWVWTIGGVKQDGSDACNDCTMAYLQAARMVRVANPTFAFRWHPQVKDEVWREVFECIRQGLGYPSIRNDPVLIQNGMHWHHHPLEEMRTWVHQACMSPCPTTRDGFQPCRMAMATANTAKAIEYALFDGYDPIFKMQMGPHTGDARKFTDFEQLYEAWRTQIWWIMTTLSRNMTQGRVKDPDFFGRPFLSGISQRSVESGLDIIRPGSERGNSWVTFFTWVENPDSLAACKKLVFEEKKYTMDQLMDALEANWDGYEEMRLDFVKNAPKWGNDDDYADEMMVRCLRDVAKRSWELKDPSGNPWPVLPENISGNIHYSTVVGALPNGRRWGDALYDGGISPGPGLDKKGPTAVLKSCGKINHISDGRAFLLNQRLSPTQLAGEKGYQLWKSYMKTWADLGLDHVQFNMVDDATLRAAQREPEKYQELIVRVAGYSAHFVDISRKTQDNIIQRTVQGLG